MLKKTVYICDLRLLRDHHVSLINPHLEFAVKFWNTYLEKDIKKNKNVQIKASNIPMVFLT